MAEVTKRFRPKRRRWPWVVLALGVSCIVLWNVAERLVQADRYRPLIVERIQQATGLPAQIGHIDLTLLPVPSIHLEDVSAGDDQFRAACDEVAVFPRLESLGRGVLEVRDVEIRGATVHLPQNLSEASARIAAIGPTGAAPAQEGGWTVSVGSIRAESARVFLGDSTEHALECDLTLRDVLAPTLRVTGQGEAPLLGAEATFAADASLTRTGDPEMGIDLRGTVALTGVDSASLIRTRNIPAGVVNVEAKVTRTGKRTFTADLSGDATPQPMEGADMAPLVGKFTGKAWFDEGTFTLNEFQWKADAIELSGDLSVPPDGAVAAKVAALRVSDAGLDSLLAFRKDLPVQIDAIEGATLTAENVLLGLSKDRYLRLVEGGAAFDGIDLSLKSGENAFHAVKGKATFHEGTIRFDELATEGVNLKGDVTPDFSNGITALDLAGQIVLTRERLLSLLPFPQISEATGRVELSRIKATFVPGEGIPADLVVEGVVKNGALAITSEAWTDRFEPLTATFTASPGTIETAVTSQSSKLGATELNGRYSVAERRWTGVASGNLAQMDLPFLKQEAAKRVAPAIVAAYGQSSFDANLTMPGPNEARVIVAFDRKGAPSLKGSLEWRKGKEAWALGDMIVNATVPGEALVPILPVGAGASGEVPVAFTRSADDAVFDARMDLTAATLTLGEHIRKASGTAAAVTVHGEASPALWSARTIEIECLGETAQGELADGRFQIANLDVNLTPLAGLLARGGQASGQVRGRIATNPTEYALTLEGVGFTLSPELVVDSANGTIESSAGAFAVRNFAVRGADSDCTVSATLDQGQWLGSVTGSQVNITRVQALTKALTDYRTSPDTTEATSTPAEPNGGMNGEFTMELGRLLYGNARFDNATGRILVRDGHVRITDLRLASDGGNISGTVEIDPNDPTGRFATNLAVTNVGAQLIDQLAFIEPRGLTGTLNGTIAVEMPTGTGINPTHGLNGNIALTGEKGSFGKLGIATKVLAVLRTAEIVRLRMPTLKDTGLTYDTCNARFTMVNGIMSVDEMVMRTPSYLITVQGGVNFPADTCELLVHVSLLETVLSAGDLVPGVREIADRFRTAGGLRILVTGPPNDPQTSYAWGPPIVGGITQEVRNSIRSGGNIIRDEVVNRATDVLREILR
ncbi:MAG: hypothetical protein IT365_24980 [Candidatus Hydrogenedentes bacterium]|nr:hypothetical protein [Candidatus Hydrogenedentota bacterium]